MDEIKLRACPFCGGRGRARVEHLTGSQYGVKVECMDCGASSPMYTAENELGVLTDYDLNVKLAVKSWNFRPCGPGEVLP